MLTYFPTPYPNEWWYSVLCRYHVRSGHIHGSTTIQELMPGRIMAAVGSLLPNSTIKQITDQLPPDIFSLPDIIQKHTLFNYFMRFHALSDKNNVLLKLCRGENAPITNNAKLRKRQIDRQLRYCPICVSDDRQKYHEAYWHIEHQIAMMSVCPVHGCKLLTANADATHTGYTFFPLEVLRPSTIPSEPGSEMDCELAKILSQYYSLPIEYSATADYNNLSLALSNMGYGVIQQHSEHTILNGKLLYHDLVDSYGNLIFNEFGDERAVCIFNRMGKWSMTSPERYAILQHFAKISCSDLFGPKISDLLEEKLISIQKSGNKLNKAVVSEQLGVTPSQLDILAKKYGIAPFWAKEVQAGGKKISCWLSDAELILFDKKMREAGLHHRSDFLRDCIKNQIAEREGN